ncbi:SRPBCC family protein [Alteromonas sediminis]|nr:SRPBCC domain-containing protein [Alteromonas sediminis]
MYISEQGFVVKNEVETHADPHLVWQALVNDVDRWWPKDHSWWGKEGTFSIEPNAGGCFCESAPNNRSAEHMRITFVEPNKLLRMTGGLGPLQSMGMYGALDWTFSREDDKTTITLTYTVQGFNAEGFEKLAPVVAKVQGQQLQGLKTFVENTPPM